LDCLNQETGSNFKPTDGNLRPIRARIREKYTIEQAQEVVRWAARTWPGTQRAEYLRPATLFGPKFDGYLQAAREKNFRGNGPRSVGGNGTRPKSAAGSFPIGPAYDPDK
jgi:uncharacterized phage protein (TIGR02220 family)